ncbi:MAG: NrfD/PsrC family molybdoenzyme membrane anchor subunit [Bacillota bacterium]
MTKQNSPWFYTLGLLAVAGFGAHVAVFLQGQSLFGTSDTAPWNILVAVYGFLAGAAAGVSFFAALGDLAGIKPLARISGPATLVSVSTLVAALLAIFSDLGNPAALFGFLTSPNLASPLWWMAMTYGLVLLVRGYKLYALNKEQQSSKAVSAIGLVLALAAPAILGTVFAALAARPFWYGASTTLFIVALALAMGAAGLLIVAVLVDAKDSAAFVGKVLVGMLALLAVMTGVKVLGMDAAYSAILFGGFNAVLFWGLQVALGIVSPLVIILTEAGRSPGGMLAAGGLALAGGLGAWFLQIVVGLGTAPMAMIPYKAYSVTLTEVLMTAGLLALAAFLYTLGTTFLGRGVTRAATGGD